MARVFDGYSRYYDLLYKDKDYDGESEYVLSRLHSIRPKATRILELGCGTGAHAVAFARSGMSVHGIDRSDSMLAQARERLEREAPDIRSRIRLASGDVRSIRTGEKYDAVISLFHVFSYLNTDLDLANAFETAAEHLVPGGVLLFDFWYGPAVLTERPEVRVRRLSDDEWFVTRIAEPQLRSSENIVDVNYSLFIEDRVSHHITLLKETHSMRYLFLPELALLSAKWFTDMDVRTWLSDTLPDTTTWSAFATAALKN
jgi:SAM-dependent methyltransferase